MAREPRDKQHHGGQTGKPPDRHIGSTGEELAVINETLVAFAKQHKEDNEQSTSRNRKQSRVEIGVAAGVAIYTLITLGLFVVSLIQIGKSSDQIAIMQDTEHRQLRAYVGLIPKDIENFGDPVHQRYTFIRKNYGTTPAYDLVVTEFGQSIAPFNQPIPVLQLMGQPPEILRGNVTLFPTSELRMVITGLMPPKEQIDRALGDDNMRFVYSGQVKYRDAFDQVHFTNFCWSYKRNVMTEKDVEWCDFHNDSN